MGFLIRRNQLPANRPPNLVRLPLPSELRDSLSGRPELAAVIGAARESGEPCGIRDDFLHRSDIRERSTVSCTEVDFIFNNDTYRLADELPYRGPGGFNLAHEIAAEITLTRFENPGYAPSWTKTSDDNSGPAVIKRLLNQIARNGETEGGGLTLTQLLKLDPVSKVNQLVELESEYAELEGSNRPRQQIATDILKLREDLGSIFLNVYARNYTLNEAERRFFSMAAVDIACSIRRYLGEGEYKSQVVDPARSRQTNRRIRTGLGTAAGIVSAAIPLWNQLAAPATQSNGGPQAAITEIHRPVEHDPRHLRPEFRVSLDTTDINSLPNYIDSISSSRIKAVAERLFVIAQTQHNLFNKGEQLTQIKISPSSLSYDYFNSNGDLANTQKVLYTQQDGNCSFLFPSCLLQLDLEKLDQSPIEFKIHASNRLLNTNFNFTE